jgi:hypothetical protein
MQPEIYYTSTGAVWADALFASVMQRSDKPSRGQVLKAITTAVRAYGHRGCTERVAQEFGDHPEAAVARMRWARAMACEAVGWVPEPARSRHDPVPAQLEKSWVSQTVPELSR